MNEELYQDLCLMVAQHVRVSAKRLLSGSIYSGEFETIASILAGYETDGMGAINIQNMQLVRLSKDESGFWEKKSEIPFEEFLEELGYRMRYQAFLKTTFRDLCQEVAIRLGIDVYQLSHGNVSESQKMAIRLITAQLENYQPDEIELFINELKKRKDNQ